MRVTLQTLRSTLRENVCEITFARRRMYPGKLPYRRMMCTLDTNILDSVNGRVALNYKPPVSGLPYPTDSKNLLPVWDIFMQDWRMVSMDYCQLLKTIPRDEFWKYFNENLLKMSPQDKVAYMDS